MPRIPPQDEDSRQWNRPEPLMLRGAATSGASRGTRGAVDARLRGKGVTTEAGRAPPAIELIGIDKSFGPVHANKNVNLVVERGVIHGIVGENGAGKSTLMSILYGFYEADAGEIRVNGEPVRIRSPREAISHGIGMVHQHFMLVPPLSVLENVMLGAEGGPLLARGASAIRKRLAELGEGIRTRSRSRRHRRRTVGRAAAAGRDPEGAGARRGNPGARRADRGADAGRGRSALRDAPGAEGREQDHRLHHPQAARDHEPHRPRLGDAARRNGRDLRHGEDLAAGARRRHGRPQGDPQDRQGRGASGQGRARGAQSRRARRPRRRAGRRRLLRSARGRDPRRRGRRRQRPVGAARSARRHPAPERRRNPGRWPAAAAGSTQPAFRARHRHRPRAGGPPSRRPRHAVRGLRERHARLPLRAGLRQGPSL